MFLCYRGKRFKNPHLGVSPYVLEATRTSVRGCQPRSGLMFLCSFVFRVSGCHKRYILCSYVPAVSGKHERYILCSYVLMFFCLPR